MNYTSINPYTEEQLAQYDTFFDVVLDTKLANSTVAFGQWRLRPFTDRLALLSNVKARLLKNKEIYAQLITKEMGKLKREAIAEIEKCAWLCDVLIQSAEQTFEDTTVLTDFKTSYISYEPLGVILGIMPWNYPFWQVLRFALPTIMAGNTVLLKHAPSVPQCALAIEDLFRESTDLEVYTNLFITNEQSATLLAQPAIKGVSITGSTKAGMAVAAVAGANIKKSVMELGGSDPFIVLADADIDKAVSTAVQTRMMNTGQSCIAAKRFIVVKEVYDIFIQKLKSTIDTLTTGDPNSDATHIAPMARKDLVDNIHRQVQASIKEGAKLLCGGVLPGSKGFFYPPTLLVDCLPQMTCCMEELFGPVATVMQANDTEHAIELANGTIYGLGASLWTKDNDTALMATKQLEAGSVFINAMVKSDPRMPFGGTKQSGYGRELSSYGLHEFVNVKTVCINL